MLGDFSFTGMREREEHPLLLTTQRLEMTTIYNNKHLTLTAGLNVNRYYAIGITTQYGVHGAFTYNFSSQFSVTAFGEYYNFIIWQASLMLAQAIMVATSLIETTNVKIKGFIS